jgi:hypothetical protein
MATTQFTAAFLHAPDFPRDYSSDFTDHQWRRWFHVDMRIPDFQLQARRAGKKALVAIWR